MAGNVATLDAEPAAIGGRLLAFKRLYRWLNLTMIQHGLWPLAVLLLSAPAGPVAVAPLPWYLARLAGPVLATVLALVTLRQRPGLTSMDDQGGACRSSAVAQVRLALVSLTVMLALARLAAGPSLEVSKQLGFGLSEAVAFQLINFGVAGRSFLPVERGERVGVLLFAVSWALRDAALAALAPAASPALAPVGGFVVGLAVAVVSREARRRLGGFWPGVAVQWLLLDLVFGFV